MSFDLAANLQEQSNQAANSNMENLVNKYTVLWTDGKVDNMENQGYRDKLNVN